MRHAPVADLRVGVVPTAGASSGWSRILEQEGLPSAVTSDPDQLITVTEGVLPSWAERYVTRGGVLVVSGAAPDGDLVPPGVRAVIQRAGVPGRALPIAVPGPAYLFRGDGYGTVRLHEDRVTKDGIEQDVFPLVVQRQVGRGLLVFTGVPLTVLLEAVGDRLRRFSPFTDVTERVSGVDKADIADVLVGMLRRAFAHVGAPYVRLGRYPEAASSVLIWRVDLDGVFGDRAGALARAAAGAGARASFYANARNCERHPGDLRSWHGDHEIGQHGDVHNVFDDVGANEANLRRAEDWMTKAMGVLPTTFVAPRGLWNPALDAALARCGYLFSSDFGLDFDSLPFRTEAGVLQIPVHPYSPERASVFAEESGRPPPDATVIRDHYLQVLRDQAMRGRPAHLYGHPEILGTVADQVLPPVIATARELRLPILPLRDYAQWWAEREGSRLTLRWDPTGRRLRASTSDDRTVELIDPNGAEVEAAGVALVSSHQMTKEGPTW